MDDKEEDADSGSGIDYDSLESVNVAETSDEDPRKNRGDEDDSDMSFAEMLEFGAEKVEEELADFEGEDPQYSTDLLVADIGSLFQTLVNIQMSNAMADEEMPEKRVASAIESDITDIIMSIAALQQEYDLDVASAMEDKIETIKTYKKVEEALEEADNEEEALDILEENMEDLPPQLQMQMAMMEAQQSGSLGVDVGDDVTDPDYDPDDPNRHIQ